MGEVRGSATPGVVLAGGGSRRFGVPKGGQLLAGRSLGDHVLERLTAAGAEPLAVVADSAGQASGWAVGSVVTVLRDARTDMGPLEGLRVALAWAQQAGAAGTLVLAVDTPFVASELLSRLAREGAAADSIAVPTSDGPRGFEPLCGWYPTRCLPELDRLLDGGGGSFVDLMAVVPVTRLPLDEVRRFGDPDVLFLNVNRPETLARAQALLASKGVPA